MRLDFKMHVGICKPETIEETERQATLDGMRAAIEEAQRDSVIIQSCLNQARYQGLNGEDTYTLLAYHALVAVEEHYQLSLKVFNLMPIPPVILRCSDGPSTEPSGQKYSILP